MNTTPEHDERIASMTFASVYPHYINKVVKKGRTKKELHSVIEWLTGYDEKKLRELIEAKVTFAFFGKRRSIRMPASSPVRSADIGSKRSRIR
jgi:hypothetical protein